MYIIIHPVVFLGIFNKYGLMEAIVLNSIMLIVFIYLYSISLYYKNRQEIDIKIRIFKYCNTL